MSESPFAQTAATLIGNGYSPLPVAPRCEPRFEGHRPPTGKEPGRLELRVDDEEQWVRLKAWTIFCTRQAKPEIIRAWSRMRDAGVCVCTGYGGLVAVDIDDDALVADILKVLPDALVGKVGKRGATYFFRTAEPMTSTNYKDSKKRGLLDYLSIGRQSVIPDTFHPGLERPYEWLTPATLLNTRLEDLPRLTERHHAEMERVLREFGWDAPEPTMARSKAVARPVRSPSADVLRHDDVNVMALANLSAWVPDLGLPKTRPNGIGYRAVAPWRGSGSGRADAQRGANLSFHPTGIRDFGDEGFTPIRVVAKARGIPFPAAAAWLRQQLGLPDERTILLNAAKSGAIPPTYPDRDVSLVDAATELRGVLDEFEAEMMAWRIYRNQSRIKPPLIRRKPPVWGVRIDTSGGKTHAASGKVADWTKRGWKLPYVVPTIKLGNQVARSLANHGVKAQVYRGREQDDPAAPGKTMCQNLPAVAVAIALGVSVRPAVCERRIDGKLVRCPSANVCGYEQQSEATPDTWIITAATLLNERPDFMSEPDGLVIDEKFHGNALGEPVEIDMADVWRAKIEFCSAEEQDFLQDMRMKLRAVAEDNGLGPLSRAALRHRISLHDAQQASILEQRRVTHILEPGMRESGLNLALHKHSARNKLARDVGSLWDEIATVLAFDQSPSGRITVTGSAFTLTPLRPFDPSWHAPMIVLDATLTSPEIIDAAVFGDKVVGWPSSVTKKADIAIAWPDCVRVRQIMDAPFSMGALGLGERAKKKPRNERDIARYIRKQAALIAPARLGVISYLGLEERLAGQMPKNVKWMHFGATSGLNDFETVGGLIVIGRWWLAPKKVEALASVFAGYPVEPIGDYYRKRTGGIRMTDGSVVPATVECHLDPIAEAVRRGITEDELSQAIGRLRAPRRGEPCFLDILGDVVMPIAVDEIAAWDDICPGAESDMMAEGVVLANSRDAMAAFDLSKRDAEEAEVAPTSLIRTHIKEVGATSPVRAFTYQKVGPGQKANTGYTLPGILAKPEAWPPELEAAVRAYLEPKLGPLSSLEFERLRVKNSAAAQAMLAQIGRDEVARIARFCKALAIAEEVAATDEQTDEGGDEAE